MLIGIWGLKLDQPKFHHWGYKAQQEGYHPEIRIWLQQLVYSEALDDYTTPEGAGAKLTELRDWTTLQITRSRSGEGQMTVTLPNPRDKYIRVRKPRTRFYGSDVTAAGEMVDTGESLIQYYKNLAKEFLSRNAPLNTEKLRGSEEQRQIEYMAKKWLFGISERSSSEAQVSFLRPAESVNGIALMQRIFVDIKGEDGQWYAGFSGIISRIDENFDVSGEPTVTLQCRDMLRFFGISQIILLLPLWAIKVPRFIQLAKQGYQSTQKNLFSRKKVTEIIYEVTKIIQDSFCYPAVQSRWEVVQKESLAASKAENIRLETNDAGPEYKAMLEFIGNKDNFWYKHNFWDMQVATVSKPEELMDFYGMLPLRRKFVEIDGSKNWINEGINSVDGQEWNLDNCRAQVCIDSYLKEAEQSIAYQFAIAQTFELIDPGMIRADAICKHAAETMWCDWYADANGDVVFQMAKMNNLPASILCDSRVIAPSQEEVQEPPTASGQAPKIISRTLGKKPINMTFQPEDGREVYDYSPAPDLMPMQGHSYNYVLVDESVKGWNIGMSEDSIVTHVTVPFGLQYDVNPGALQDALRFTGYAEDAFLQGRYGIRCLVSSKIFAGDIVRDDKNGDKIRDAIAEHLMRMVNGGAMAGSIRLINRPDLDVGRTVLLFERQVIGYIDAVNLTVSKGQPITTNLTLSYIHDISRAIPNPWVSVRELLE